MKYGIIFLLFFSISCASDEEYMLIDRDFCAQIHFEEKHPLSTQLEALSDSMAKKTGVYTLESGDESMISRAYMCESAEKSIDIQYFIFSSDNVGLIAIDYLLRAADRGVKVRLLVDDIMVDADADELLALDAHPNLSIKIYNPSANIGKNLPSKIFSLSTNFYGFNQRMHNKTFIVDGIAAITGGRNVADEYFDYDHEYNFRDRDVLLLGKTVSDMQSSFDRFWENDLSRDVAELVEANVLDMNIAIKYEYLHQYACNPINFWPQVREKIRQLPEAFKEIQASNQLVWVDKVYFVSDLPGKNAGDKGLKGGGLCTDALIELIEGAQKSIYIQSPYLITTELGQQLFKDAVDRGVDVFIQTNSLASTDNVEAFAGYKKDRDKLLEIGVHLYEFKPDALIRMELMTSALQSEIDFAPIFGLHAKSMLIDEKVAIIGTFNLDPRSANLNTECVAIIYDSKIAFDLFTAMKNDIKPENAWHTTQAFNPDDEASYGKQFKSWWVKILPKSIL